MENLYITNVSIIMATYNRAHFIEETLVSIQNQTYKNWECIIIDDGGTDNTLEILQPFLLKDNRFKYLKRPSNHIKGLPGCRNFGIDKAKGEYIIFFDDDDIIHPDNLGICVATLVKFKVDYIRYLREVFIQKFSKKFDRSSDFNVSPLNFLDLEKMIIGKLPFNSCQVLWKKKCFKNIRFNEQLMYAEEWECYSRILISDVKGISIDKTLFFGRKHENSNTGEYKNRDNIRIKSHISATLMVLDTIASVNLFNNTLKKFFIRLGLELHSFRIIKKYLNLSNAKWFDKIKYKIGFQLYPFIKPLFRLKSKF